VTAVFRERTSRQARPCSWDCGSEIAPGDRYVYWSLPPLSEGNDEPHWVSGAAHGATPEACPTFVHGEPAPAMDVVWKQAWRSSQARSKVTVTTHRGEGTS
jgi:hypothetical protein